MKDENGRCMKNIEILLKRRNMTKKELEKAADLSDGYLSRCKTERKRPKNLVEIADVLGTDANFLVDYNIEKLSPDDKLASQVMEALVNKSHATQIGWRSYEYQDTLPKPEPQAQPNGGESYYADLGDGRAAFLIAVETTSHFPTLLCEVAGEVELHLAKGNNVKFICSTNRLKGKLSEKLYGLYHLAEKRGVGKHLFWDDETRAMVQGLVDMG